MSDRTRGWENFANVGQQASPLWDAIDSLVMKQTGKRTFDDLTLCDDVLLDYQPSPTIKPRYDLVEGHSRYTREREPEASPSDKKIDLGPVELDLICFAKCSNPSFLVLLGGMGSGKSTTIKFLWRNFWQDYKVVHCDFDAETQLLETNPHNAPEESVVKVLVRRLSPALNNLIPPDEEIRNLWSWALSNGTVDHPAKNILSDAQDKLRAAVGNAWLSETDEALNVRKQALAELQRQPLDNLDYQALRVDYYLSCHCGGDRSRFLLILDNVDPLPPRIQHHIFTYASRVQTASRCKTMMSLRPLTYSSNLQGANRLIEVVEHVGPSVIDLIRRRIENRVVQCDLSKLMVSVNDDGHGRKPIKEAEAKRWAQDIVQAISDPRSLGPRGDPNARAFIEGICGHSLRSALIVAPKIFGSPVAPPLTIETGPQRQRIRDHDVIRSIVDSWRGYYAADPKRVTDNIFDLGSHDSCSCTSKIRLLKKLKASHSRVVTLGEVRQHLAAFGYQDKLILDTINSVMAQSKRLAWSDSVARYETLDGHQNSRLQLSSVGEYYIDHAMFNLEYVQGVHVDVLLPREDVLQHDPRKFADRLRSLELFVRYLHGEDLDEVKRMLRNPQVDYVDVYGATLFSVDIVTALERQIKTIGGSMLRGGRTGREAREDIMNTITRWDSISVTMQRDSQQVLQKIASLRPDDGREISVLTPREGPVSPQRVSSARADTRAEERKETA